MKLCLTGSHGTGKSTLLKILKEKLPDWEIQTESLTRKAVQNSNKVNFGTTDESEKLISELYMKSFLNSSKNFIAGRHMIDVLAYSIYLKKINKNIKNSTIQAILKKIQKIRSKKIFDLIIYIPIEFKQKESGEFREGQQENPNYQKDIDTIIKFLLWKHDISYITVTGTPEQRVEQILKIIKEKENVI